VSADLHAVGRWLATHYEGDLWCPGMRGLYPSPPGPRRGQTYTLRAFRVGGERWWPPGAYAERWRVRL